MLLIYNFIGVFRMGLSTDFPFKKKYSRIESHFDQSIVSHFVFENRIFIKYLKGSTAKS